MFYLYNTVVYLGYVIFFGGGDGGGGDVELYCAHEILSRSHDIILQKEKRNAGQL